jgi:hypothetical protein
VFGGGGLVQVCWPWALCSPLSRVSLTLPHSLTPSPDPPCLLTVIWGDYYSQCNLLSLKETRLSLCCSLKCPGGSLVFSSRLSADSTLMSLCLSVCLSGGRPGQRGHRFSDEGCSWIRTLHFTLFKLLSSQKCVCACACGCVCVCVRARECTYVSACESILMVAKISGYHLQFFCLLFIRWWSHI